MKKRIPIIIILIVIILAFIIGTYFLLYKNDNKAITENSSDIDTMQENIVNDISDETNAVVNESENLDNTITETNNENLEKIEEKQESQITTKNTQSSNKTQSSSANNNSSTPKKEAVTKSPSQATNPKANSTAQSSSDKSSSKQEETKAEPKVERCTNNNNHGIDIGNSKKWFNSKNEAVAYYNDQISYWGNQWENEMIDNATYYKNCPAGYEIWSCMYCGKWTINFYYR